MNLRISTLGGKRGDHDPLLPRLAYLGNKEDPALGEQEAGSCSGGSEFRNGLWPPAFPEVGGDSSLESGRPARLFYPGDGDPAVGVEDQVGETGWGGARLPRVGSDLLRPALPEVGRDGGEDVGEFEDLHPTDHNVTLLVGG